MAVELSASRLVAPFFGTSTFVWTNIIGIIMIALSVGYLAGGKLADRKPHLEILLRLLFLASLFLLVIPFIAPAVTRTVASGMKNLNSSFSYIFFGSMTTITLLFSFPVVIMGMTSPFLIRIIAETDHIGSSAGRIFGVSTIGSIIGTFLPILIFIPAFGTGKTILFFGALQLVVTTLGFSRWKYSVFSAAVILPFFLQVPPPRETPGKIYATESAYEYIEVVDRGPFRSLIYNDGIGAQTVQRKDDILTGRYYDYFSLLPYLSRGHAGSALILGLGGGVIANQLHEFHQDIKISAAEIDPKVIQIAKKYFSLTDASEVYNQDGRIFVNLGEKGKYDIIVIDAYTQQLYIPFHLTTREFFQQVKNMLPDQGIVAMNVVAWSEDSRLIRSIVNTLHLVFAHVYQIRTQNHSNNIVLASAADIDFGLLIRAGGTKLQSLAAYTLGSVQETDYDNRYPVLTDDRAPVERMVDWQLLEHK